MRVRFRVGIQDRKGKRLGKEDLMGFSDTLLKGMRYVAEFKYLEATKWLMLAEDCMEKYLLLALLNLALGQESQGRDFLEEARRHPRATDYLFVVERPEEGLRLLIERPEVVLPDFLLSW